MVEGYSSIPVTSCFAGYIVSEPTLLFVITLDNIADNDYQLSFCQSVVSFVSGASELLKLQKTEQIYRRISDFRRSFEIFFCIFRNF